MSTLPGAQSARHVGNIRSDHLVEPSHQRLSGTIFQHTLDAAIRHLPVRHLPECRNHGIQKSAKARERDTPLRCLRRRSPMKSCLRQAPWRNVGRAGIGPGNVKPSASQNCFDRSKISRRNRGLRFDHSEVHRASVFDFSRPQRLAQARVAQRGLHKEPRASDVSRVSRRETAGRPNALTAREPRHERLARPLRSCR